jgi:hypothetical protein
MGLFDKLFGKKEKAAGNKHLVDTSSLNKTSKMMEEEQFWSIIKKSLSKTDNQDNQEAWLISELQKLPLEEIIGFRLRTDKLLYDTYTSEMWCAAYIMNGGCSDDDFEYFRCWLISRGENTYQKARQNPDSLIDLVVTGQDFYAFESFWYVALQAFERNTGKDLYEFVDYDNFKTCEGAYPGLASNWQEDDIETMKRICPKLVDIFR